MKHLRVLFASFAVVLILLPAVPAFAATNVFSEACKAKGSRASAACQQTGADPLTGKNGIITKATALISYLAGVCSILLILVSAFLYVTADGDSSKIQSARTTLIYALVGLVVIGVAQGIIIFVLNNL
jgi:hypothetical protein